MLRVPAVGPTFRSSHDRLVNRDIEVLLMLGIDMLATERIPNGLATGEESLTALAVNLDTFQDQSLAQLILRFKSEKLAKR